MPWTYLDSIKSYLTQAGYNVTYLHDTQVTLNVLTTQLNDYDIVLWRTNAYNWHHVDYWYVGELTNQATLSAYASDVQQGWLDNTNAILGISIDFVAEHFPTGSLNHVKFMMVVSSISVDVALIFLKAGVKSIVDYYGAFSLTLYTIDYTDAQIMRRLASFGQNVHDAVWDTVSAFSNARLRDPIDSVVIPPVWYLGDGLLKLK